MTEEIQDLKKRTWCYIMAPHLFEIAPCSCGNEETQWSEYEEHLWCDKCEKDFIPKHNGIFDGPIPIGTAEMMGLVFDRYNIKTQKQEIFDSKTLTYSVKE